MEVTLLVLLLCLQGYWPLMATNEKDGESEGIAIARPSQDVAGGGVPEPTTVLMEPSLPQGALPDVVITQDYRTKRWATRKNIKSKPGAHSPLGSTYPEPGDKTQQDPSVHKERGTAE